jgi:uncharacterized protein
MAHLTVPLELKSIGDREIEGHGSTFGNVDLGGDIVVPGAFKRSLAAHRKAGTMPQMFWMHQPDRVPGKWVEMAEDGDGLAVKGVLADTDLGREMRTLAQMKAVRGLSIGYQTKDFDFDRDGNRLLKEINLWEVSLVSLAMNPMARIESAKARLSAGGEYVPTAREFERALRDVGCSKTVSRRIVAMILDGDDGGTPSDPDSRWDADDEGKAILASLERWTDSTVREVFR